MIFKKPYAFLIKNFRIIHLVLTFLIGFLLFRTYNLYTFFSRYVSNIYATLGDAMPSNYVTIFMFLVSIIIVAFSLAMYLLMRKKDKPKKLYIFLSIYYVVYLITLILYFVLFKSMDTSQLSIRNAMIVRDLTLILAIPQAVLLIMSLIRGVGFDIKSFNFSKDLKELDLSEEDNEEFEFVLGVDTYKYSRMLRRRLRELKYYILENKFMFIILVSLLGAIIVIMTILNFTVYNRTYGKNQKINANNLILQVNNSYITDTSYTGDVIEKGKNFLVANITFTNPSGASTVLELSNYPLETKNGKVYPTLSKNQYFIDLGAGYARERIEGNSTVAYILVYELDAKDVQDKYTLQVIDEVEYNAGSINTKKKSISLKPLKCFKKDVVGTYEAGTKVEMYGSNLRNSTLKVDSIDFKNKYTYKYEACIRTNCSSKTDVVSADSAKSRTLMILSADLDVDENSEFSNNFKSSKTFFDVFVTFEFDGNISNVEDITPNSVKDKYILSVDSKVAKAEHVNMLVTVRNKQYVIKLK